MATIFQRGNFWEVQVRRTGLPTLCRRFKRRVDADGWAAHQEAAVVHGAFGEQRHLEQFTFDDLLARYARDVTPTKKSRVSEEHQIRLLRRESLARLRLSDLSAPRIAEWRDHRLKEVSGSTVNRNLNLISHIVNVARREWGLPIQNPVADVRRPKNNRGRKAHLTSEQEIALLGVMDATERRPDGTLGPGSRNPWLRSVVVMALETAMRRGELLAIRWRDVDLEQRVIHLYETKNGDDRDVPLSSRAVSELRSLGRGDSEKVFPTSPEAIKKAFARAASFAGLPDLRFHDLRHIATTRLSKRLTVLELSSVTGHKTLAMLKRYYHPDAAHLATKLL